MNEISQILVRNGSEDEFLRQIAMLLVGSECSFNALILSPSVVKTNGNLDNVILLADPDQAGSDHYRFRLLDLRRDACEIVARFQPYAVVKRRSDGTEKTLGHLPVRIERSKLESLLSCREKLEARRIYS